VSSTLLKRTYQLLLCAYSKGTRAERGAVELDTLLSVSRPNQRLPKIAEARAIAKEGIRDRIRRNAGQSTLEIVGQGAALGVLFTMSIQLWWFAVMSHKFLNSRNLLGGQETVHFVLWGTVVALLAIRWAFRPSRVIIGVWQLANVTGAAWFFSLFKHQVRANWVLGSSRDIGNLVVAFMAILSLLALSSVVAIWCWSHLPKNTPRRAIGAKVALLAIVLPVWASPLSPVDSSGFQVFGLSVIFMLVVGLVDPRPLIGLGIALLTPMVALSVALITNTEASTNGRLILPALTLTAIALVSIRVHVVLRRLPN
jgi:hypothetical protein